MPAPKFLRRRSSGASQALEQTAGTGSQQHQASRDIINNYGVSAADVFAITNAEIGRVRSELTELASQAESIVEERLEAFQSRVIEEFAEKPDLRSAFADPDFQFSLRDAGRAAVSNDDKHTEDLLLDLLRNRAEQGNGVRVRLATSHAIRAADKLSEDALKGITAIWAIPSLGPQTPGADTALVTAQTVGEGLIRMGLPTDQTWVDDADVLNLVRLGEGFMTRTPYRQFMAGKATGYLNHGVDPTGSAELISSVTAVCPWVAGLLTAHPMKPGFLRLHGASREELAARAPIDIFPPELEQLVAQNGYGGQDNTAVAKFNELIEASPEMKAVSAWWDSLRVCNLTLVGSTVGFVNARRFLEWQGAQTVAEMLELPQT